MWLEDGPRRGRIEAAARRAYPNLTYTRRRRADHYVSVYRTLVDVPGYEEREVTVEFDHRYSTTPKIFADGPSDPSASPHRYPDRGRTHLCIWYPHDPSSRTWVLEDGLLALFGMAAEHLFKEAWWREHDHQWLGEEYPHGELSHEKETS
ncbi:MAG: hypothetical protein EOO27_08330 [Comamonadaceae bacterium]|nr:MAG: hypothetical protein EOO27_08330 [Comamonadaceae bacterium]